MKGVSDTVGLAAEEMSNMHISVHEANAGCLVLSNMETPRMTLKYKHYCTKYHIFREQLEPNQIHL